MTPFPDPRLATPSDLPAVDALLARCYPAALKRDYAPSILVTALPIIVRAQPKLLSSDRYWITMEDGRAIACGGWSAAPPRGDGGPARTAHVRHVAADPDRPRAGLGRRLMRAALAQAAEAGMVRAECLSTRNAVPFYAALGFQADGEVKVPLAPGVDFPSVAMHLENLETALA